MIKYSALLLSFAFAAANLFTTEALAAKKILRCPKAGFYQTLKVSKKCHLKKSIALQPMDEGLYGVGGGRGGGGGGGGGGGRGLSDFRLKHHLVRVGTTVYGLPLYDFEYNFETGTFEGVMAQDVLKVNPEAVSVGNDGFYRVNYDLLGIQMKRIR